MKLLSSMLGGYQHPLSSIQFGNRMTEHETLANRKRTDIGYRATAEQPRDVRSSTCSLRPTWESHTTYYLTTESPAAGMVLIIADKSPRA